jgi:cell division GTPase FtsZ
MFKLEEERPLDTIIKVVGVGVQERMPLTRMIATGMEGVEFIVAIRMLAAEGQPSHRKNTVRPETHQGAGSRG